MKYRHDWTYVSAIGVSRSYDDTQFLLAWAQALDQQRQTVYDLEKTFRLKLLPCDPVILLLRMPADYPDVSEMMRVLYPRVTLTCDNIRQYTAGIRVRDIDILCSYSVRLNGPGLRHLHLMCHKLETKVMLDILYASFIRGYNDPESSVSILQQAKVDIGPLILQKLLK
jgi:hypothetical protein